MQICFDVFRAVVGSVAAGLVISGVVTKNSFEQLGVPNHPVGKPAGMGLFVAGWLLATYAFGSGRKTQGLGVVTAGACLSILGAVMYMKGQMGKGKAVGMIAPAVFALAWLVLGQVVAEGLPRWGQVLGVVATALVLGSMMGTLPMQRKAGVGDGPGMPMFTAAWALIVALNSVVRR